LVLRLALAGCAGTEKISLESRNIALEPGPVPATGGLDTVSHLIPATGPTYVTLNVKELSKSGRTTEIGNRAITSGSGYVVDGSGLVMTAAHVAVEEGNEISARAANGRVYSGKVIAINPGNDMASSSCGVIPAPP
jgi:S1-C subfamily serine protease